MELFDTAGAGKGAKAVPLAERMRPKALDEFVGQQHLLGPGKFLRGMVGARCVRFSAVTSGVKDLKKIVEEAERLHRLGKRTVLFVDEIHHFNKAQQD